MLNITSFSIRAPEIFESIRHRDLEAYLNVPRIITNIVMGDLANCVFVLLLGNVWVEEQKSRQKAERLTKQVETLATDLERNRIARDIHDTLGHSLTSLDVQIELAQRLQATEPARAQQAIDLAKKLSSQALDNVRQALGTMKRSNFDLTEAIVALAEQNHPFQIFVDVSFPQLSLQSSYQLYCIIQESITNIQKHAQAERVTITSREDEYICQSLQNGALGYILKSTPSQQLATTIRSLNRGFGQLDPAIAPQGVCPDSRTNECANFNIISFRPIQS